MKCKTCCSENCFCQPFWKTFDRDVSRKNLRVSTITFNFKLSNVRVHLSRLSAYLLGRNATLFTREFKFKQDARKSRTDKEKNFQMYNSCIITGFVPRNGKPGELTKVAMKVFHNGSVNVTGCRSVCEIVDTIHKLVHLLTSIEGVIEHLSYLCVPQADIVYSRNLTKTLTNVRIPIGPPVGAEGGIMCPPNQTVVLNNILYDTIRVRKMTLRLSDPYGSSSYTVTPTQPMKITDVRISMINTDFSLGGNVRQNTLRDLLECPTLSVTRGGNVTFVEFDPDKYHAVKIGYVHDPRTQQNVVYTRKRMKKVDGEVTIAVFNTGSVIITGGKRSIDIIGAYHFTQRVTKSVLTERATRKPKRENKVYLLKREQALLKLVNRGRLGNE